LRKYLLFLIDERVGWVCGLGHGVLKTTPEENVKFFVKKIRESFAMTFIGEKDFDHESSKKIGVLLICNSRNS